MIYAKYKQFKQFKLPKLNHGLGDDELQTLLDDYNYWGRPKRLDTLEPPKI